MLKRRENYTPPAFLVASADVDINIHDDQTIVTTKLVIVPNPDAIASADLQLDGREIQLISVSVDGVQLRDDTFEIDNSGIKIKGLTGQHIVETISQCHPESNTALEGLYLSGDMYSLSVSPKALDELLISPTALM